MAQSGSAQAQVHSPASPTVQCHDCLRLGIACSFLVPTRTRGPKRRLVTNQATAANKAPATNVAANTTTAATNANTASPTAAGSPNPTARLGGLVPGRSPTTSRKRLPSTPREGGDDQPESARPEDAEWHFSDRRKDVVRPLGPVSVSMSGSSPYGPSPPGMSPALDQQHTYPTDELCSRPLLLLILNDYLDLIYPLVPVVHRPTFRASLAAARDVDDAEFLALIIAIAALTVGLLPSRFPVYRQSMSSALAARFKTRMAMINCCMDMCMRLRYLTPTYWDQVSHRKWAVCYLLSVGCFQTGQTNRSRMLEVESMQIGRLLGFHRIADYDGLNLIEKQLRKKAFWLTFYAYAHGWHQCGRQERLTFLDHSMLHEVSFEALFPLEVDDERILETKILDSPQPPPPPPSSSSSSPPTTSQPARPPFTLTSGFNLHSRVFYKSAELALSPGNCDWARRHTPEERLARLRQLLQEMRYMLDDVPGPMRQWATPDNPSTASTTSHSHSHSLSPSSSSSSPPPKKPPQSHLLDGFPPRQDWPSPLPQASSSTNDANAKALPGQVEIMRANLHGTHLWIQSSLLDRIDALLQEIAQRAGSQAEREAALEAQKNSWAEREDVCRQMLHLLHSMPYSYLEPNGLYLVSSFSPPSSLPAPPSPLRPLNPLSPPNSPTMN